jgi:hypothetical protein
MIVDRKQREAVQWLSNEIENIPNFTKQPGQPLAKKKPEVPPICEVVLFKYNATHGNSFGYWDKFPLVIMVRPFPDHFFGFNLHYLNMDIRTKILSTMNNLSKSSAGNKDMEFRKLYPFLSAIVKVGQFNFAYKNYSYNNFESEFLVIHKEHYHFISQLPIAKFEGNKK